MKKLRMIERIRAYKLSVQVAIDIILFVIFLLSVFLYTIPEIKDNEIASNLILALFTSILVSFVTVTVDIIVAYNKSKNEEYLESLREFGIGNLYLNKEEVLRKFLEECDRMIWVSGYRLILTKKIKNEIAEAIKRGADFYAVICPPWTEAFKMVYGSNEKVLDNYFEVFHAVKKAFDDKESKSKVIRVVFVNKPIFSDTYRVDQKLLTGPYMHNKDEEYHLLMAKDFFSYNLVRDSKLSKLINDEYITLFDDDDTKLELDWDAFENVYKKIQESDLNEAEKIKEFRSALKEKEHGYSDK